MIIGIDPGATGAIAILNDFGQITHVLDMPSETIKTEIRKKAKKGTINDKGKPVRTVLKIQNKSVLLHKEVFNIIPTGFPIALETVTAMPGQGVTSMFGFGSIYGALKMVCEVKGSEVIDVTPQKWQKHFGVIMQKVDKEGMTNGQITKSKKQTIANKVLELYPNADIHNNRGTLKDGRADAILIARYLWEIKNENA